jgi:hypothetical protein
MLHTVARLPGEAGSIRFGKPLQVEILPPTDGPPPRGLIQLDIDWRDASAENHT